MSIINKININGNEFEIGGGEYTLPTASETELGGVKVGNGLSIDETGVLSANNISEVQSLNFKIPGVGYNKHSLVFKIPSTMEETSYNYLLRYTTVSTHPSAWYSKDEIIISVKRLTDLNPFSEISVISPYINVMSRINHNTHTGDFELTLPMTRRIDEYGAVRGFSFQDNQNYFVELLDIDGGGFHFEVVENSVLYDVTTEGNREYILAWDKVPLASISGKLGLVYSHVDVSNSIDIRNGVVELSIDNTLEVNGRGELGVKQTPVSDINNDEGTN